MSENRLLKISILENKIQVLDTERASLVQELNQLKKLSHKNSLAPVTQYSPSTDKIQIGRIGGGKRKPTGIIDVPIIQSLFKQQQVDDLVANYGQVIFDEFSTPNSQDNYFKFLIPKF